MTIKSYKRSIGINFNDDGQAIIIVWAPSAKTVDIKIENEGMLSLHAEEFGYWTLTTPEITAGDKYWFVIDGEKKLPDPAALFQPEGVHGPSQAVDLNSFGWTDTDWENPDLTDYIFYELHTGTFSPEGDFAGIEKKLDHLLELGVTAIEIMPVAQFAGSRNWGYDGVFPYAVQNSYGGPKALQQLVNICHSKGLAVVLDVVYNHLGPEGNYLSAYAPYFTEKYKTPWGNAVNFDDAYCDPVRQYFTENVLMWFRDFHIDGLRMDAVHAIKDFSPKHILKEIKERVNGLTNETGRQHYLIIECDLNDTRYINTLSDNGYGADTQWSDEFHHALRVTAGQESNGYYNDFTGIADLAKAYTDAYVYTGQYSEQRHRKFGVPAQSNPGSQFIVFSQNHDQVGNRMLGERTSNLVSFEMQKLMAAAIFLSPYLPLIFMGEELSEINPFQYFVSHIDSELIEMVRKGRKDEFKDFHGDQEAPDPQSIETFQNSKIQWDLLDKQPHKTMFAYYKALINLRRSQPALIGCNRGGLKVTFDEGCQTLQLSRFSANQHLIALMNFSGTKQMIILPSETTQWKKLFDSANPEWLGPASAPSDNISGATVELRPESVIIYQAM